MTKAYLGDGGVTRIMNQDMTEYQEEQSVFDRHWVQEEEAGLSALKFGQKDVIRELDYSHN